MPFKPLGDAEIEFVQHLSCIATRAGGQGLLSKRRVEAKGFFDIIDSGVKNAVGAAAMLTAPPSPTPRAVETRDASLPHDSCSGELGLPGRYCSGGANFGRAGRSSRSSTPWKSAGPHSVISPPKAVSKSCAEAQSSSRPRH